MQFEFRAFIPSLGVMLDNVDVCPTMGVIGLDEKEFIRQLKKVNPKFEIDWEKSNVVLDDPENDKFETLCGVFTFEGYIQLEFKNVEIQQFSGQMAKITRIGGMIDNVETKLFEGDIIEFYTHGIHTNIEILTAEIKFHPDLSAFYLEVITDETEQKRQWSFNDELWYFVLVGNVLENNYIKPIKLR